MPILYEWLQTHILFRDHLTEMVTCDKADCDICREFGVGLRTPVTDDGRLRDILLCPMDRPINNADRVSHFVAPEKMRAWIAEKKMTFLSIEGCAWKRDNNPYAAAEDKADQETDA